VEHAYNLGLEKAEMYAFMQKALQATTDDTLSADELVALVMECGANGVTAMATLDEANTTAYGNPEITEVNIGVSNKPGILISGHDLKDMEDLLKQTEGTGVDVYTHSEMLPANYYPAFKKYEHFVGNYGNAWWKQNEEFETLTDLSCLLLTVLFLQLRSQLTKIKYIQQELLVSQDSSILLLMRMEERFL